MENETSCKGLKELHYSLEHLSFIDKIKIVGRHSFNNSELQKIPLWSEFKNEVEKCKKKRNFIAHGDKATTIEKSDVDICFFVAVTLITMVQGKKNTFKGIKKHIYK